MKFIADFHIHSHYSIATSKNLILEYLDYWARLKGINVVGTGDFTHPGWLKELKEKLEPAESGLFRLKQDIKPVSNLLSPLSKKDEIRFMLTAEISNIYKKMDKVRKVHNLIFAPDFETVEKIQQELDKIGNITSDGRPILGLDSRNLLEIALNCSDEIFFVPAHIWTPWFSALGAKSGFDSIEECYSDLSGHIYAVETGLSSDPPMNWMCSFLDKYTLISNSDAHSPEKLGREANLFDCELSYQGIIDALKTPQNKQFLGTIEFFPQEGKYHHDGHRKCGISWDPLETLKHAGICPECGKKVTVGVLSRVAQLSDRFAWNNKKDKPGYHSLIPLKEILSEISGVGPNSKKVTDAYNGLIKKTGSEFNVLLHWPLEDLHEVTNDVLVEGIRRMRKEQVYIKEGFDGEYGQIKVFNENEQKELSPQTSLFSTIVKDSSAYQSSKLAGFDLEEYRRLCDELESSKEVQTKVELKPKDKSFLNELNREQRRAVEHDTGPALIIAGPGTGKTRVLTCRIAYLIAQRNIDPATILALTFTNKAAKEMKERLSDLLSQNGQIFKVHVSTFHALGYHLLTDYSKKNDATSTFTIIDEEDKSHIIKLLFNYNRKQATAVTKEITYIKQNAIGSKTIEDLGKREVFEKYQRYLNENNLYDLDDLIYRPVLMLKENDALSHEYRRRFQWILVDEYQDINHAQYQLIRLLAPGENSNLCVIGDPNQAIYGFRGADVQFIQRFKDNFPGATEYHLSKSYRCSNHILRASGEMISGEKESGGSLLEGLQDGVKIILSAQKTEKSEAEFIARTIEQMMGGLRFFSMDSGISSGDDTDGILGLSDFAVLCRIKRQIPILEKAFRDHSIPYQAITDEALFNTQPAGTVVDILKVSQNPKAVFFQDKLLARLALARDDFGELIVEIKNRIKITEKIQHILRREFWKSKIDKMVEEKLLTLANNYDDDLNGFLRLAAIGSETDTYRPDVEQVTLMTMHASKGLEFKCVFIAGCEDGLIPYSLFQKQKSSVDEERRLLYVGMTRAQQGLFMTYARKRFLMGREYKLKRSPFIDRIEKELIEQKKSEYKKPLKKDDGQLSLFFKKKNGEKPFTNFT